MPNLNDMIPVLYESLDRVSRELTGFIPAVSRDSTADRAAKGQNVRSPIAPAIETEDITPGNDPADSGDHDLDHVDMEITKSKAAPVRWKGEDQRGVAHSGQIDQILTDQFTQAMRALVNEVERDIAGEYYRASRAYGTAGTTPFGSSLDAVAEMRKILDDNGAPMDDGRNVVINTSAGVNLRSLANLNQADRAGTDDTLRRGVLLPLFGFDMRESAGIREHSNGSIDSVTVDGSHEEGATEISVEGTSIDLKVGDVVEISDHKYVVAEAISNLSNKLKIREPGLQEGMSGGESVSLSDNYAANLAFHRSALHLVTRAPAMPEGGDAADDVMEIEDPQTGLAFQVALYRQYRRIKYEVGLAWGAKGIKPDHMALLLG